MWAQKRLYGYWLGPGNTNPWVGEGAGWVLPLPAHPVCTTPGTTPPDRTTLTTYSAVANSYF